MTDNEMELSAALRWLVEQWCDRRCLNALRYVLTAYPTDAPALTEPTTNGKEELLLALKDIRAFARGR